MDKVWGYLTAWLFVWTIVYLVSYTQAVQTHEQALALNCQNWNGVPKTTFSNYGMNGKTVCNFPENTTAEDRNYAASANALLDTNHMMYFTGMLGVQIELLFLGIFIVFLSNSKRR